jgi:hypothetical protein
MSIISRPETTIVSMKLTRTNPKFDPISASGVVIHADKKHRLILTASHVVDPIDISLIDHPPEITFVDGSKRLAHIIATTCHTGWGDLALLYTSGGNLLPKAQLPSYREIFSFWKNLSDVTDKGHPFKKPQFPSSRNFTFWDDRYTENYISAGLRSEFVRRIISKPGHIYSFTGEYHGKVIDFNRSITLNVDVKAGTSGGPIFIQNDILGGIVRETMGEPASVSGASIFQIYTVFALWCKNISIWHNLEEIKQIISNTIPSNEF